MLIATFKIESEISKGVILERETEFETIKELEDFISYNRAYIRELSFRGAIKVGA